MLIANFATREDYIAHILRMKETQPDYARAALKYYDALLPWANLKDGVRDALMVNT
jgi:hypothetical protein